MMDRLAEIVGFAKVAAVVLAIAAVATVFEGWVIL